MYNTTCSSILPIFKQKLILYYLNNWPHAFFPDLRLYNSLSPLKWLRNMQKRYVYLRVKGTKELLIIAVIPYVTTECNLVQGQYAKFHDDVTLNNSVQYTQHHNIASTKHICCMLFK